MLEKVEISGGFECFEILVKLREQAMMECSGEEAGESWKDGWEWSF